MMTWSMESTQGCLLDPPKHRSSSKKPVSMELEAICLSSITQQVEQNRDRSYCPSRGNTAQMQGGRSPLDGKHHTLRVSVSP